MLAAANLIVFADKVMPTLDDAGGILETLMAYIYIIAAVGLALTLLHIICYWILFSKAGYPGWAQFIPIYNVLVFLWIAGKPWWWIILLCIPIIGFPILAINALVSFCKAYGYGVGMALGLIFFPIIFLPVMAFSGSEYVGQRGDAY